MPDLKWCRTHNDARMGSWTDTCESFEADLAPCDIAAYVDRETYDFVVSMLPRLDVEAKAMLTIGYDHDTESPNEYSVLRVLSGNVRHSNCEKFDAEDVVAVLTYYEHGEGMWSVGAAVPDYGGFDTVENAGVLVIIDDAREWWDGLDEAARGEAIRATLDTFNDWWNGNCYFFTYGDLSVGGFIGMEDLKSGLVDEGIDRSKVTVDGDAAWIVDAYRV